MKIYIGADHRGFALKNSLKKWLVDNGNQIEDSGAINYVENDDFVGYAISVAQNISKDQNSRGIVICGSGAGVEIVANKIHGVRCSLAQSIDQLVKARQADDINILAIASDFTDFEKAKELVQTFLNTEFVANDNHKRRIGKIKNLE